VGQTSRSARDVHVLLPAQTGKADIGSGSAALLRRTSRSALSLLAQLVLLPDKADVDVGRRTGVPPHKTDDGWLISTGVN